MARKFEVPGSPRTKIRAELSSNGSDVTCRFDPAQKNPRRGLMGWGSLVGEKAPDLLNDILLVSCSVVRRRDTSLCAGGASRVSPADWFTTS